MRKAFALLLWVAAAAFVSCSEDPTESLSGVHDLSKRLLSIYLCFSVIFGCTTSLVRCLF